MDFGLLTRSHSDFRPPNAPRASAGARHLWPSVEELEQRQLLASVVEYQVPSPGALPSEIIPGPDGNLWFTQGLGNHIGMINPRTHDFTLFALPQNYSSVDGITVGPDGNLWFTDILFGTQPPIGAIGTLDPATGAIREFPEQDAGSVPMGITTGPGGDLWFTNENNKNIGIFNPTTDSITLLAVPVAIGGAMGITTGPDGNIWVSLTADNSIGKINPTTIAVTVFPDATDGGSPEDIIVGPDGNLWFNEVYVAQLGRMNPTTGAFTQIPITDQSGGITAGADGKIWFTEYSPAIGMINPTTHAVTTYPIPAPANGSGATPEGIAFGPDGNIWFADTNGYAIGVLDRTGTASVPGPKSLPRGVPFGFTLTVNDARTTRAVGASDTVKLSLDTVQDWGESLMVSTGAGVSAFVGLTLKKHRRSYHLVNPVFIQGRTPAARAGVVKDQTLLVEKELTAGTGKHKHVIGVEVVFSKSLHRQLARDFARQAARGTRPAHPVELVANFTEPGTSVTMAGYAREAPGGRIVVIAKSR